jgi:hypothetical protein
MGIVSANAVSSLQIFLHSATTQLQRNKLLLEARGWRETTRSLNGLAGVEGDKESNGEGRKPRLVLEEQVGVSKDHTKGHVEMVCG